MKQFTICYFGIFDPTFSRNAVYIRGLEENGVRVILCTDTSTGYKKYIRIIKRFLATRKEVDAIIIGYAGHTIVPFARLLNMLTIRKPIIFDALCSFYEGNILSRDAFKNIPFRKALCRSVDWLANKCADFILVETLKQKEYYIQKLHVPEKKCIVAYTGVDDRAFFFDSPIKKNEIFTILFRGKFTPEAGISTILESFEILERAGENIRFRIIGFGWGSVNDEIQRQIKERNLKNLEFINERLPIDELRKKMLECHVSLGQFASHERLERTIPHKAFEALVMKLPYITATTEPTKEIFENGKTCLFVNPADSSDLVFKVLKLKNDPVLIESLIKNGFELYKKRFIPKVLVNSFLEKVISFARQ